MINWISDRISDCISDHNVPNTAAIASNEAAERQSDGDGPELESRDWGNAMSRKIRARKNTHIKVGENHYSLAYYCREKCSNMSLILDPNSCAW
jgi:hypothetical protein